ncbi:hypothetical protein FHR24_001685 [Wenyingzhuangia heitensis]|uniref:Outer membrane protein beta-barrel domain-containing protein n=1 Tax=Wenyingzhuangia heitensis TaxID=1487859 RepID=A0ABX0UCH5_9FLAO|nr:hypothetical protein [Wenyingzhuangia heitensis]NIJ45246.1 hypothetical protein [Wenyingzhuangia heitensis]
MKQIKLFIIMGIVVVLGLCSTAAVAQNAVIQFSLDPTMLANGPYADSDHGELDFMIKGSKIFKENNEIGIFVEQFSAMNYTSAGFLYNRKVNIFPETSAMCESVETLFGIDAGAIKRDVEEEDGTYLTAGLNAEFRFLLSDKFGFNLTSNYRYRGDLANIYNDNSPFIFSGYVGVFYKL